MVERLKQDVWRANRELVSRDLVIYTWGNVSGIDRRSGLVVIKPSGVEYDLMEPDDMVVVELATGKVVEGRRQPSSDTQTHLELYRAFPGIGGITHTHSLNASAFAQAGMDIRVLGTTHGDDFHGAIPCTRELTWQEVREDYEANTGKVIVERVRERGYDPMDIPGVLVRNHGPFTWGKDPWDSVCHGVVLEMVAEMGLKTLLLNPCASMAGYLLDKHFKRKHGQDAYYGQMETRKIP